MEMKGEPRQSDSVKITRWRENIVKIGQTKRRAGERRVVDSQN